jgi:hypothetical protein
MTLDFLKERYDFELDRKDKLTAALALPVGVLTVLGGLGTAMLNSFTFADQTLSAIFVVSLLGGFIAFTSCLVFLGRAYLAQTYAYLPLLGDLKKFEDEMAEFSRVMAGGDAEVAEEFNDEFQRRIIAAADANTLSNDERSKWMHWSRIMLFVIVGFAYIAGVSYGADQVRLKLPKQEIPKPNITTLRPTASQKPTFPANRVIKEGREPGTIEKK